MEETLGSETPNFPGLPRLTLPFVSTWKGAYESFENSVGIRNPGNLCYRNVVLQLLLHTPVLLNFLGFYCTDSHVCSGYGEDPCTLCLLKAFVDAYWTAHRSSERLEETLQALWTRLEISFWALTVGDVESQQDVREFLEQILCQVFAETKGINLSELFKIVTAKQFQCPNCERTTTHPCLDKQYFLLANFPDSNQTYGVSETIVQAMHLSTMKRMCDYCKAKEDQIISDSIIRLPEVLLVQVNRFTDKGGKRQQEIEIKDLLCVSDRIRCDKSMDTNDGSYELYSVIFHHGKGINNGHYTIAVRIPDGSWAVLNDDADVLFMPTLEDLKESRGSKFGSDAYILAYRRLRVTVEKETSPSPPSPRASPKYSPDALSAHSSSTDSDGDSYMSDPDDSPSSNHADSLFDDPFDDTLDHLFRDQLDNQLDDQLNDQLQSQLVEQSDTTCAIDTSVVPSTEPDPGTVSLDGSMELLGRDIEWTIGQQLVLPPDVGPLIKLGPRAKVQRAKFKITLTHSGEVLEGEATISLKPRQMGDGGQGSSSVEIPQAQGENLQTELEVPNTQNRTPIIKRLRPRAQKTTTSKVMNTRISSSVSSDRNASSSKKANPRGITKRANTEKPTAGKAPRPPKPAPKESSSESSGASSSSWSNNSSGDEDGASTREAPSGPDYWVRRSKRRYNPVTYEDTEKSPSSSPTR